jgi:hypothetical protein
MPLSQAELMVEEQARHEASQIARMIRAVNLATHGKKDQVQRALTALES